MMILSRGILLLVLLVMVVAITTAVGGGGGVEIHGPPGIAADAWDDDGATPAHQEGGGGTALRWDPHRVSPKLVQHQHHEREHRALHILPYEHTHQQLYRPPSFSSPYNRYPWGEEEAYYNIAEKEDSDYEYDYTYTVQPSSYYDDDIYYTDDQMIDQTMINRKKQLYNEHQFQRQKQQEEEEQQQQQQEIVAATGWQGLLPSPVLLIVHTIVLPVVVLQLLL